MELTTRTIVGAEISTETDVLCRSVSDLTNSAICVVKTKKPVDTGVKQGLARKYASVNSSVLRKYTSHVSNEEFNELSGLIRRMNVNSKRLVEAVAGTEDHYLYQIGVFNGIQQSYKALLPQQNSEKIFNARMARIIERKNFKDIIRSIYQRESIQNKRLCELTGIKPNVLNPKMKALSDAGCVKIKNIGKNSFYSLSDNGKRYARNILGCKKDAVTVDAISVSCDNDGLDRISEIRYTRTQSPDKFLNRFI